MSKSTEASIAETAFNCPYCDAYAAQNWLKVAAQHLPRSITTPDIMRAKQVAEMDVGTGIAAHMKAAMMQTMKRKLSGEMYFEYGDDLVSNRTINNLHVSECHHCQKLSIWVYDKLVYPKIRVGEAPSPELSDDIRRDVDEARGIADLSPRGATALLRLALQKLCKQIGESGEDLNKDIGNLVAKGRINPTMQKALDAVRVFGNEAVHPGTLDLSDDRDTASFLLAIINTIAYELITHPKDIHALYERLPAEKRQWIDDRNAGAIAKEQHGSNNVK